MSKSGMTTVRVMFEFDCDICEDTKEVEMMYLGNDGHPSYTMSACICTVEDPNAVGIRIMSREEARAALRNAVLV